MNTRGWVLCLAVLAGSGITALYRLSTYLNRSAGPPLLLTPAEQKIRHGLTTHINKLSVSIGERNIEHYSALTAAAGYIENTLHAQGYAVKTYPFSAGGKEVRNIEVWITGQKLPAENVIVGAHYDSAPGTPGANDNGSGVAAALELARLLKDAKPSRTIHFVFFVNEEPPYFQSEQMGSLVYARQLRREHVKVTAMMSLETIAYYSDEKRTQHYPSGVGPEYPDTGNFIGFVANTESRSLLTQAVQLFKKATSFPVQALAAPAEVTGVGFSDQWSFWQNGYHGIMVTDTAMFRYPHYHQSSDTADKLDLNRTARVVAGLQQVVIGLANE